jgi:hypothetical protein
MVLDIFNSLRGLVFQEIKHSVFPVLVMFSWRVFLTTESEFLKTKRGFCQGTYSKTKTSLSFYTGFTCLVVTGVTLIPIFHKFARPELLRLWEVTFGTNFAEVKLLFCMV